MNFLFYLLVNNDEYIIFLWLPLSADCHKISGNELALICYCRVESFATPNYKRHERSVHRLWSSCVGSFFTLKTFIFARLQCIKQVDRQRRLTFAFASNTSAREAACPFEIKWNLLLQQNPNDLPVPETWLSSSDSNKSIHVTRFFASCRVRLTQWSSRRSWRN